MSVYVWLRVCVCVCVYPGSLDLGSERLTRIEICECVCMHGCMYLGSLDLGLNRLTRIEMMCVYVCLHKLFWLGV